MPRPTWMGPRQWQGETTWLDGAHDDAALYEAGWLAYRRREGEPLPEMVAHWHDKLADPPQPAPAGPPPWMAPAERTDRRSTEARMATLRWLIERRWWLIPAWWQCFKDERSQGAYLAHTAVGAN
jgi:hypothetical protein